MSDVLHLIALIVFVVIPTLVVNQLIAIWAYKRRMKRRDNKFIKWVHIKYPGSNAITYISIDSSDEEALVKLKEKIQDGLS